jgi:transcriptional regulator with XRE-family HTH domain
LEDEFIIMSELIKARQASGLTQAQIAERMCSTQPAVARLEAGGRLPSTRTLQRYAEATGHRLEIRLVPVKHKPAARA